MKVIEWFKKSNRDKHFIYAVPIGFFFTILCVLGVATALEFKDYQYCRMYDWNDWLSTMLGGLFGQVLFLILIYLFFVW